MSEILLSDSLRLNVADLRRIPLFVDLSDLELAELVGSLALWHFDQGAILMRQGDRAHSLLVLQAGRAEVLRTDADGSEIVVATLRPGDVVGELGLLTGATRSATVRAAEPLVALVLSREIFASVIENKGVAR